MADSPPTPQSPAVAMFLLIVFTAACFVALFLPRVWRKGCSKTWRWFGRTSADGPCYRCCCTCMRRSVGRVITGAPQPPAELRCRAITSSNATLEWKHEGQFLAEDTFELEVNLVGAPQPATDRVSEAEGGEAAEEAATKPPWLSIYEGGAARHREMNLTPDTAFVARVRTVNAAGSSDWHYTSRPFLTRQVPFKQGGVGPALAPPVRELIGAETSAAVDADGAVPKGCAYTWTQTDDEVFLKLLVPAGCRGRDFQVDFRPTSITVVHKPTLTALLDGPMYKNVRHTDCTWDLEVEECLLSLGLEKSLKSDSILLEHTERWSCVIAGCDLGLISPNFTEFAPNLTLLGGFLDRHPQIDINIKGEERPSIQETLSKHFNR